MNVKHICPYFRLWHFFQTNLSFQKLYFPAHQSHQMVSSEWCHSQRWNNLYYLVCSSEKLMLAGKTFLANKFINQQYNMLTEIFTIFFTYTVTEW